MIKVKNIDQEYGLKEVFNVAAFNKNRECIYKNLFSLKTIFKTENKDGEKYNTVTIISPVGRISDALNFVFDCPYIIELTSCKRMRSNGKDLPIKLTFIPEDIEVWFECCAGGEPLQYYTKFYFKTINEE
jgi:hypothetical protein